MFIVQIASIFYYLCVVTLQYVAPIIMCLYFALMYKTLGGYRWSDIVYNARTNLSDNSTIITADHPAMISIETDETNADIFTTAQLSLQGLKSVQITSF